MQKINLVTPICLVFLWVVHSTPSQANPGAKTKTNKSKSNRHSSKNKTTQVAGKNVKKPVKISIKTKGPKVDSWRKKVPFTSAEAHCKKELKQAKAQAVFGMLALKSCQKTLKASGAANKKQLDELKKKTKKLAARYEAAVLGSKRRAAKACKRIGHAECADILDNRLVLEFEGHVNEEATERGFRIGMEQICALVIEKACMSVKE